MVKMFCISIILNIVFGSILLSHQAYAQPPQTLGPMDPDVRKAKEEGERRWGDLRERVRREGLSQNLVKIMESIYKRLGSEELILKNLGEPKSKTFLPPMMAKDGKYYYAGSIDLEYEGLEAHLIKETSGKTDLTDLIIKNNNPKLELPVNIGMSKDTVIDYLGNPGYDDNGELGFYWLDKHGGITEVAVFKYKNDKIVEIRFDRFNVLKK